MIHEHCHVKNIPLREIPPSFVTLDRGTSECNYLGECVVLGYHILLCSSVKFDGLMNDLN